jgi:hypothetical protein
MKIISILMKMHVQMNAMLNLVEREVVLRKRKVRVSGCIQTSLRKLLAVLRKEEAGTKRNEKPGETEMSIVLSEAECQLEKR